MQRRSGGALVVVGRMTVYKKRLTLVFTEAPFPQLLKAHRKPS